MDRNRHSDSVLKKLILKKSKHEKSHMLFWSKCSIFHDIFKSFQNLT